MNRSFAALAAGLLTASISAIAPAQASGTTSGTGSGATPGSGARDAAAAAQSIVMSRGPVETAQWGLRRHGHDLPADGNLDRSTQRAFAEFQRDNGLPATCSPDPATLNRLGAAR